jgi:hypothetical protein
VPDQPAVRPQIQVDVAEGGWPLPWPNVAEIAEVLPWHHWTLVGGLMTQLHTVHRGLGLVRPTDDVDIVLHIETARGVPTMAARALESLGYRLQASGDSRDNTAHRWVRDGQLVDVLTADHPAPKVIETMRGRDMVAIEGGTQALRRTIDAVLGIRLDGPPTTISVPRPYAAVILKAAAYVADSRDRDRHLFDAAALLACIEDPFAEAVHRAGSDLSRLRNLARGLPMNHLAWSLLDPVARQDGQAALRILGA